MTFLSSSKLKLCQFSYFGDHNAQIRKLGPDPQILTFFIFFYFFIFSISMRFQRALNQYSMTIIDQNMTKYH